MNRVCVLGSMNMDLVVKVNDIPRVGETILSKSFEKIAGGKGANQAVAAKRCGAEVAMIAKIGKDENGEILKDKLKEDNIDVKYVFEDKNESTGMAFIMVNENGNNSIIVVAGSNMTINKEDIEASLEKIEESDILIAQFETSEEMTLEAFKKAKEFGKVTILNPAPAKKINEELLKVTDIIVPNETEAEVLTGITVETLEDANKAGKVFLEKGVKFVVITLGDKGAAVIGKDFCKLVPSYKVNAIDTTAAGDSFIGGLSSKLDFRNINKETLIGAVNFGNKVSSISVQRKGAQPSIPYLKEIEEIYGED
ncbi:ribokinase [Clostridium sp. D43t1_170807_H7]|uniref:ribokinase n=2 Tax=unclassified Clostridium TaxID=2614128 RepID=UPI001898584A|nr:ribokinase [Clostridium sp. D43t1_170807_H7]